MRPRTFFIYVVFVVLLLEQVSPAEAILETETSSENGHVGDVKKTCNDYDGNGDCLNTKSNVQPPLSKDCDDEDDCKPSHGESGDDSYDVNDKKDAKYTVITGVFSPPKEKNSHKTLSNGGNLGMQREQLYEVITKIINMGQEKETAIENSNGGDSFSTSSNTGKLGTVYEVISTVIQEKTKPLPSKECDDEDDCKPSYSGNGNEEKDHTVGNGDFKGLSPSKETAVGNSNGGDSFSTSSNTGKLGTVYEVISTVIQEKTKPLPSKECDDEDDCKPSYSGNGNEEKDHTVGNGDFKGLSPSKETAVGNSNGGDSFSTSSNTGKLGTVYEVISTVIQEKTKEAAAVTSNGGDAFSTSSNTGKPGTVYEVISTMTEEKTKPLPSKECDDEEDCKPSYSGNGNEEKDHTVENGDFKGLSPSKETAVGNSNGGDSFEFSTSSNTGKLGTVYEVISTVIQEKTKEIAGENSNGGDSFSTSSNTGKLGTVYEVISTLKKEKTKPLPSKECDDEDDCKPSYSGNGNEEKDHTVGNGDFKGLSPLKETAVVTSNGGDAFSTSSNTGKPGTVYEVISTMTEEKTKETAVENSNGGDSFSTSSNTGKLGTVYEVITTVIQGKTKPLPSKECDDEDDCKPSYSGDGNEEKDHTVGNEYFKGLSPLKGTAVENSNGGDSFSTLPNTGKLGTVYEVITKLIEEKTKKQTAVDSGNEGDSFRTSSNTGKLGTVYEVISTSIKEKTKPQSYKECDDEDDCKPSYTGSGNEEKDHSVGNEDFKGLFPSKETAVENSNGGYSFSTLPNTGKLGTVYEVISKSIEEKTKKQTAVGNSNGRDSFSTSSNTGKLGTVYEVISTSIKEKENPQLSKECDDEDDCKPSYSGSGNEEKDNTAGNGDFKGLFPSKKQTAVGNSNGGDSFYTSSNTGKLETVYEVISASIKEKTKTNDIITCDETPCGDGALCMFNRNTNKSECICPISKRGVRCSDKKYRRYICLQTFGLIGMIVSLTALLFMNHQSRSKSASFFTGTLFRVFPPIANAEEYVEAEMSIMPLDMSGLIIYNGWQPQKIGDFISLSLRNGFVELRFNCGSGMAVIRSMKTVIMKRWHKVKFHRTERLGSLIVNTDAPVLGYSPGPHTIMSLHQNLLIGGVSNDAKHEVNTNAGIDKGFTGFIQNLKINGKVFNLIPDAVDQHAAKTHPCSSSPCKNGGTCLVDREEYSCLCTAYYTGRNCAKGLLLISMLPR